MKVKDLIKVLSQIEDQDLPVRHYDSMAGEDMDISGAEVLSQRKHVGFKNECIEKWVRITK